MRLAPEVKTQEIKDPTQAYWTGLSNIMTKYHANDAEMITTLNRVSKNMGYAYPRPCIILEQVIPIVIKG